MTSETLPQSPFLPGTKIQFGTADERDFAEWLFKHAIVNGECLECHLKPNAKGYCNVQIGGRSGIKWRVHRLIWTVVKGPITEGMGILHTCDNRKCFRPDHLFEGTESDNTQDMMQKGRGKYILPDNRKIKDINEVVFMRNAGLTYKQIAEYFNVSPSTIMNNLRRYVNG